MNKSTTAAPLIALACLLTSAMLFGQGRIDRDVVFAPEGDACVLTGQPTKMHAQRNFVIVWHVTNHCPQEIGVELGGFTFGGQAVESPVEARSVSVPTGKRKPLFGLVMAEARIGTYSYEILIQGGQGVDPELVIDPSR